MRRGYRIQYTTDSGPAYTWNEFGSPAIYTAPANGVFIYSVLATDFAGNHGSLGVVTTIPPITFDNIHQL